MRRLMPAVACCTRRSPLSQALPPCQARRFGVCRTRTWRHLSDQPVRGSL